MKILITGSHVTPALATIVALGKIDPAIELVYVGRRYTREGDRSVSVESVEIPKAGVKFIPITTGRLQRKFTVHTVPSLFKIPFGFIQSMAILLKEDPDVILSFGGYVSVPVVVASWLFSKPIIIHSQTLISGLANTISGWFADKIAVSFDLDYAFSKSKQILTGNPIRSELFDKLYPSKPILEIIRLANTHNKPVILITGGNQGSHVLNLTIFGVLNQLNKKYFIVHQTGDSEYKDYEQAMTKREGLLNPDWYLPAKWLAVCDMGYILRKASLAVSRAGVNSLQELAYFSLPTITVPIPYIYQDEQLINSRYFEKLGLVKTLLQSELTPSKLNQLISQTIKKLPEIKKLAMGAKKVVIKDAAYRLALETLLLANYRND